MEVIDSVSKKNIEDFAKRRIKAQQTVRTDAYPSNNGLEACVTHIAKITPPEDATEWLPRVYIAIANLKRFLLGTFHGTSRTYLQEYLNEFCYRFNRRFWENEIPNRLLRLCIDHRPLCGT
jgi:transposase-like protein